MRKLLVTLILLVALPLGAARDFSVAADRIANTTAEGVSGIDVDQFSISFWYTRNDAVTNEAFFFFGTDPTTGGKLGFLWISGALTLRQEYSGARGDWTISDPSLDAYHNILLVCDFSSDANDPVIYVDGTSVTVTEVSTPSGTRDTGIDNIVLGEVMAGSNDLDASMAEFYFWDTLLTQADASILAAKFSPNFVRPGNRILYIPLVRDVLEVVQGIAMTVTGTSVVAHPPMIYPTQQISGFAAAAVPPARDLMIISRAMKYAPLPLLAGGMGLAWVINRRNKLLRDGRN